MYITCRILFVWNRQIYSRIYWDSYGVVGKTVSNGSTLW
jgi:hypothetical protein